MARPPHSHSWHTFHHGTEVLDTVTGMDGVVMHSRVVHSVEPAGPGQGEAQPGRLIPLPNPVVHETTIVRLEDGSTVERSPKLLVAHPQM